MNAEVYYDDLGKDFRKEEIPAELMDVAEEYRAKLVEEAASASDELTHTHVFLHQSVFYHESTGYTHTHTHTHTHTTQTPPACTVGALSPSAGIQMSSPNTHVHTHTHTHTSLRNMEVRLI